MGKFWTECFCTTHLKKECTFINQPLRVVLQFFEMLGYGLSETLNAVHAGFLPLLE